MRLPLCVLVLTALIGLMSCGLSIGPQETERVVKVHDGQPGIVAEEATVLVMWEAAGAKKFHKEKIGGWVVMPKEHFDALMTKLQELSGPKPAK